MKKIRIISFFVCLISIYSCVSNTDNNTSLNEEGIELIPYHSDTIPFTMDDELFNLNYYNKILFKGKLLNKELTFRIDNGWYVSGLRKKTVLAIVNIKNFYQKETDIYNYYYPIDTSNIINIQLNNYLLKLDSIDLNIENDRSSDGIIGFELFANNIVEIDFSQNNIVLHNKLPKIEGFTQLEIYKMDSIKLPNETKIMLIKLDSLMGIDKQYFSEKFLLDLGSAMSIFSPAFLEKIDINVALQDSSSLKYSLLICNKRIGGNPTHYSDNKPFFETYNYWNIGGFVGVDFFKQFHVFFDYPHNKLYLKPNKNE
jgi:hypothetical protein